MTSETQKLIDGLAERIVMALLGELIPGDAETVAAELQQLGEVVGAAEDMTDLATLLDDDDPYFGERRNATERIARARAALAALREKQG